MLDFELWFSMKYEVNGLSEENYLFYLAQNINNVLLIFKIISNKILLYKC